MPKPISFIGIDPGFTGAIAALDDDGDLIDIFDTPTFKIQGSVRSKKTGKLKETTKFDKVGMSKIIRRLLPCKAALESVHSMPEQGIVGAFAFGHGLGLWEGILSALDVSVEMPTPQLWKKTTMQGMGKEKDASRLKALSLFPEAPLERKKDHNRADALLIALWLYRTSRR